MFIINGVYKACVIIYKLGTAAESIVEVKKVFDKDKKDRTGCEIVNAVAQGVYATLQITDIGVNHTFLSNIVSSNMKQNISNWNDGFRVVSLVTKRVVHYNEHKWCIYEFGRNTVKDLNDLTVNLALKNKIAFGIFVTTTGIRVFLNIKAINNLFIVVKNIPKAVWNNPKMACKIPGLLAQGVRKIPGLICQGVQEIYNNNSLNKNPVNRKPVSDQRTSEKQKQNLKINPTENSSSTSQSNQTNISKVNSILDTNVDKIMKKDKKELIAKYILFKNIDNTKQFLSELEEIPKYLEVKDKNKKKWPFICSISGKPIRFIVIPALGVDGIFYEEEKLGIWIDTTPPNIKPNDWPENIPLPIQRDQFIKSKNLQTIIDDKILEQMDALENLYEYVFENLPKEDQGIYEDEKESEETGKKNI